MSKLVEALKIKPTTKNHEVAAALPDTGTIIAATIAAVGVLHQKELKPDKSEKIIQSGFIDTSKKIYPTNFNSGEGPICGAICRTCHEYCIIRNDRHSQHSCGQHTW